MNPAAQETAMENVWNARIPRINEAAPDFTARTTHGPRSLQDYRGKWLILFSHPADFTPVCTTEFLAFARGYERFRKLGCELLGLSIDSNYSHLAWVRNIKEKFGVEIPFPIIDDLSMRIAHDYGMIQPGASDTSAVRATFFIDPAGKVRAMVYYPMTNGRSVEEFLRLLEALQTSDRHGIATPEGWRPGEKVMVPPPATAKDAEARAHAGYEYTDWYFSKTDVPQGVPKKKRGTR
jgi:peroxiredoxin (alkyl hydroperoxide reductase subunit C)